MLTVIYCEQNLLFVHPDHLCFDRTTYDNINGPGGPFMSDIIGPAGPLMYPDQIFCDRFSKSSHKYTFMACYNRDRGRSLMTGLAKLKILSEKH